MSDADALLHDFQSITEPLSLEELFPLHQRTELEIGCGDGGFLFEYAQRHSNRNFLGVERLLGRLRKLSKKGLREGLANLRLLRIEARYVLQYLLPELCSLSSKAFPFSCALRLIYVGIMLNLLPSLSKALNLTPDGTT